MKDKTKLQRYNIKIEARDDGWYSILVPDLPDVKTQTANLHDAEHLARHAIGQWLEVSPDLVVVTMIP